MEALETAERDPDPASAALHDGDLRLARAALAGDPAARRAFAEQMKCVPKFLAVINARMGRPLADDALEDAVQATLIEIWRRLDSYAGLASLRTWAYGFCQRVMSTRVRDARRRPDSVELVEAPDPAPDRTSTEDYGPVYAAIDKLGDLHARIVRHKHFDRWTFDEIGRRMQLPSSTAKVHYQRALSRLREILDPLRKEGAL